MRKALRRDRGHALLVVADLLLISQEAGKATDTGTLFPANYTPETPISTLFQSIASLSLIFHPPPFCHLLAV
ncbi:MAG: hypothetical protein GY850_32000 [bacterium]|nr:hypothetical protein [bacterium]